MAEKKKPSLKKIAEAEVERIEDLETLQQALDEERERAEKYLANWQRTQADFINYKKRAEQEKMETINFANSKLILNLLTIMDDFERAFVLLPAEVADSSWTEGVKLIYNEFKSILEAEGLAEVGAVGKCFDPYEHEAVICQEGEEEIIIEEIQKGYKLKGKVIRPTKVIVGKGKAKGKRVRSLEEKQTWEKQ